MTWIALADSKTCHFAAEGLSNVGRVAPAERVDPEAVMPRGSILLETRVSPHDRPQIVLGLKRGFEHGVSFSLQALPGGGLNLVHERGAEMVHGVVNHDSSAVRTDILRITYSWDMVHDWARLVVERPEANRSFQTSMRGPVAMQLSDIREMTLNEAARQMAPDVLFFAVSDRIEPIGPMPGMIASTMVETPFGQTPVGKLQRGDILETLDGAQVPVLQVLRRTVPARGLFEPVRLRQPYFGLAQDTVVAPFQRLVIGGSRVEYLFNAEQVLVPARHLVNGSAALREKNHLLVTYTQVLLPDHQALLANGTYMESMNIGRIRRTRNILQGSLLGQFSRTTLPEHSVPAYPALGSFEALILAEQRAA
ncbi:Hint domain-containing protein [uncultured Shimia sp.]|uniref:Hint domain-containing protein n=1 Tax=uncultured Shimia sp. TaxID=573152 RepID=UPI00263219C3|nr:Hint domain-containing protein [uncultured Shimia sp.]